LGGETVRNGNQPKFLFCKAGGGLCEENHGAGWQAGWDLAGTKKKRNQPSPRERTQKGNVRAPERALLKKCRLKKRGIKGGEEGGGTSKDRN